MLQEYHWPGNVRELKNVMARALINLKKDEKVVETRHLMFSLSTPQYGSTGVNPRSFKGKRWQPAACQVGKKCAFGNAAQY